MGDAARGDDAELPSIETPIRVEAVLEGDRSRVTRMFFADGTMIRKQLLGPDARQRLRHETEILERVRGVDGVTQLVTALAYSDSLVLADAGNATLVELVKPMDVGTLLGLAAALSQAVAGLHHSGVLHRDISPANVVVSGDRQPTLIGFGLAMSVPELRPGFTHHSEIVGTLAYLAPESTGRTGRPVDQRADLYALGATLYELATGTPPFGAGDPLTLIHDHLARSPRPPAEVNPAVPQPLSQIILHLLEKEPDRRYQSADGLLHDLERLRATRAQPAGPQSAEVLRVGGHDVPLGLLPPSQLVGREEEMAALQDTFEEARTGRCRIVLTGGPPGVGKTALVDQLRPVVSRRNGWFVAGKFDQYRRDLEFDGVAQAFRALGRLLLAEPEDDLAEIRRRLLSALGPNAGLASAVSPELAALLGVPPDAGDPLTAQLRAQRNSVEILRAVASRERPLVFFVDDLQWAGRTPLGVFDLVASEEQSEGLLLVGAYRDSELDTTHPLNALLSRCRDEPGVRLMRLDNLSAASLTGMVAEMLHVDATAAQNLAGLIGARTSGNPYETVELLDALHRAGLLTATADGWHWDTAAIRVQRGEAEAAAPSTTRISAMPPRSRAMMEAMACLGGQADLGVLQVATGAPAELVERALAPALEEGLLVVESGGQQSIRFRHDRLREMVLLGLEPTARRDLELRVARRLAAVPELFPAAAEHYQRVADTVSDPAERRRVVELLRRSADQATLIGDHARVNTLLTSALQLIDPADTATLIEVHTCRHAARYSMGLLEEADADYRAIDRYAENPLERADATKLQVRSLTHRNQFAEAVALGTTTLRQLGIMVPGEDRVRAELDRQFEYLHRWVEQSNEDDLLCPEITDPTLIAATQLLYATSSAGYMGASPATVSWLGLEAVRIWLEHGPGRTLLGPASIAAFHAKAPRGDNATAYRAMRRVVALGEARGYEPETSQARYMFSAFCYWFEPLENAANAAARAREGLIAGGDLANAGYSYATSAQYLADCSPTLESFIAEVETGLAFVARTGTEQTRQFLSEYRWLGRTLRGEQPTADEDAVASEPYADSPLNNLTAHVNRAIAAAIFGDSQKLSRHTAAVMPLLSATPGTYPTAVSRVLRGIALAEQARGRDLNDRADLLAELDGMARWLAARAADAPDNFLHLQRLLEAEREWAAGDFRAAVVAFDAAQRDAAARQRPWHRALILERAAHFYLAHGITHTGYDLLAKARSEYQRWGATAKVAQLDWAHPNIRPGVSATAGSHRDEPPDDLARPSTVTTGTLDLLGILSASQALSSETSLPKLHDRVVEVLGALAGATNVHLLPWDEDRKDWLLPTPNGTVPASAGDAPALPLSVLRYVRRTREPLVVADATSDERFARDPYLSGADRCALLALPILSRGTLRAVLLLENRMLRGAFTSDRLDAVNLIAGQLAVSLENAQARAELRAFAQEQAALRRVATLVASGPPPEKVFAEVTAEIGQVLGVDFISMLRYEHDGAVSVLGSCSGDGGPGNLSVGAQLPYGGMNVHTEVFRTGRPARWDASVADPGPALARALAGIRTSVGVPISVNGRLWGVIVTSSTSAHPMPADIENRLAGFTELVGTAIANADGQAALAASRARVVAAADAARRRVERNLHDGAQQRLVSMALELRTAQAEVPSELGGLSARLDRLANNLVRALDELRETARGLHPTALSDGGLPTALKSLGRRSAVPVRLDVHLDGRLPEPVELTAYYSVAEALTNAAKHAGATVADVRVEISEDHLFIQVHDDGRGGADLAAGTGLISLTDRIEAVGGQMNLHSPPGAGTTLTIRLPLQSPGHCQNDPERPAYPTWGIEQPL